MKVCTKCGKLRSLENFSKSGERLRSECKACSSLIRAGKGHLIPPIRYNHTTRKADPRKWTHSENTTLSRIARDMNKVGKYATLQAIREQDNRCHTCITSLDRYKNVDNTFIFRVRAHKTKDGWRLFCGTCSGIIRAMSELHSSGPLRSIADAFRGTDHFAPRISIKPSQVRSKEKVEHVETHGDEYTPLLELFPCLKQKKSSWELHLNTRKIRGNSPKLETALYMMFETCNVREVANKINKLIQEDNLYAV